MYRRLNAMLAIVTFLAMFLLIPAVSQGTELNLGGGYPLWDTHTDANDTSFNGGYLIYGSIDTVKKDSTWLSYGMMYNMARIELEVKTTTTHEGGKIDWCTKGRECPPTEVTNDLPLPIWTPEYTTTSTDRSWLSVHVLGPYVKPFYKLTDRVKVFGMIGMGAMYVDGVRYGDEFGGAGFASAGLSLDITKHLGMGAQMLYVKGATSNVDDIDYIAPVATISYRW